MAFSLFPKSIQFFTMLNRQNKLLVESARMLAAILENTGDVEEAFKKVNMLEAEADLLCREISHQLSQTFITPIDREDIYGLNLAQEDCINLIKALSTRFRLYGFSYIRFPARKMAQNLTAMAEISGKMLEYMSEKMEVSSQVRLLKGLKNECEMLLGTGLAELLHDTQIEDFQAVIDIMKWTQVYDRIEMAFERVDDLSDTIEEVVLKNA